MIITQENKSELLHLLKSKKMFGIEHMKSIHFQEEKKNSNKLPSDLNSLYDYASNCSLCELSKSKISFDFDKGDRKSKIVIITLNSIDENTKEFDNLNAMVKNVLKININHIYMTNILKCKVKVNSDNVDKEINQCINYLEQQVSILQPEIIITFGIAFKHLMNSKDDVIDVSGNLFEYNGIKIVPLLGIDFINKNPSYKEKMFSDLKKIKKIMDEK